MGIIKQNELAIYNNNLAVRVLKAQNKMYKANFTVMGCTNAIKAYMCENHNEYCADGEMIDDLNKVLNRRMIDEKITELIEEAVHNILLVRV